MTSSQGYLSELFGLDGRVAVVTGGSSGIGRAIATALGHAGARVVLVARDQGKLIATAHELEEAHCDVAVVSADLGSRDAVRVAAEEAAAPFGESEILVNCAGVNVWPPWSRLMTMSGIRR